MDASLPQQPLPQPSIPTQPAAPQIPEQPSGLVHFLTVVRTALVKNRTLALFLVLTFFVSVGTGTYILVSPAKKEQPQQNQFLAASQTKPTDVPTEIPTQEPTPTTAESLPPDLIATPTTPPVPTPTTNPTAGWNSYVNTAYSYTIRYPLDWTVLNLDALEPLVPSYIVFNPNTASTSARSITVGVSNRTYDDQIGLNAATGSQRVVAGITGIEQHLQDSNRNTSIVVTVPRTNNLLVFTAKTAYQSIFDQMLTTLTTSN